MKTIVGTLIIMFFFCSAVYSKPVSIEPARVLPLGAFELKIDGYIDSFNKINNEDRNSADLVSGETRNSLVIPFNFKFGVSDGQELGITVPFININHTIVSGAQYKGNGIGDITLLGRKVFKNSSTGIISIGLGVKAPIGKSVFQIDKEQLATGTGTWDVFASLYSMDSRMGQLILHGFLTYTYRFDFSASKIMGETINNVNVKPGYLVTWGVGGEFLIPATVVSLLAEVTGKHIYGENVTYSATGENINNLILAKSYPEISIQRTEEIYVTPALQIAVTNDLNVTAGVRIPISIRNNYLGTSYLISGSFKFGTPAPVRSKDPWQQQ